MIVTEITSDRDGDAAELSAVVRPRGRPHFRAWFRFSAPVGSLPAIGDPFVAGFLIPCMYSDEELRIEGPVSRRLLASASSIQELIRGWYPQLRRVSVTAAGEAEPLASERPAETGAFYSGGVDSVYSLLTNRSRIDHLILVHGFENPVADEALLDVTLKAALPTVETLGKKLLIARTNLRGCADPRVAIPGPGYTRSFFGFCYQGSILAAVGLCLQQRLGRILIPASHTPESQEPYGTHPSLDPLWSTEGLTFLHDGHGASRFQKIRRIMADAPFAARRLQVCETSLGGEANCCGCEKCLRTMLALRLCGALEGSETFLRQLRLEDVRRLPYPCRWIGDYRELSREARQLGDRQVAEAVGHLLSKSSSRAELTSELRRLLRRGARRTMPRLRYLLRTGRLRKW